MRSKIVGSPANLLHATLQSPVHVGSVAARHTVDLNKRSVCESLPFCHKDLQALS